MTDIRKALHDAIDSMDAVGWDDARTTDLRWDDVHAVIDTTLEAVDSLDAAWAEAEAAEQEARGSESSFARRGIVLFHGWMVDVDGVFLPRSIAMTTDLSLYLSEAVEHPRLEVTGPTPAAALRALAAKLREREG